MTSCTEIHLLTPVGWQKILSEEISRDKKYFFRTEAITQNLIRLYFVSSKPLSDWKSVEISRTAPRFSKILSHWNFFSKNFKLTVESSLIMAHLTESFILILKTEHFWWDEYLRRHDVICHLIDTWRHKILTWLHKSPYLMTYSIYQNVPF